MVENSKKQKCSISEEDISTLLQRYTATTLLALLQEVELCADVKLDWKELVKKSNTGITNAREYQMLWRHLAYRGGLDEKLEDGAEPLDDDSDLECELEPFPSASNEASVEAAACVKVLIASGSSNSCPLNNSVEAPLTINAPNGQSCIDAAESSQLACSVQGMNITVPVSVQRYPFSTELPGGKVTGVKRRRLPKWSEAEDEELLAAVEKFGVGNWTSMVREGFKGDRNAHQLSQRYKLIMKKQGNNDSGERSTAPRITEAQPATRAAPNSGERSTDSRFSEAILATRCALSQALGPKPKPNLTATCSSALKTLPSSSVLPRPAAAKTPNQVQRQSQQSSSTSVLPPPAAAKTSNQIQRQSQQGSIATKSPPVQQMSSLKSQTAFKQPKSMSCTSVLPTAESKVKVQSQPQSQQSSLKTEPSPAEASGSTMKSQTPLKKPPAKSFQSSCSILEATAVAAGARIGSPKTAASLLKAANSPHVIRVPSPSGGPTVKHNKPGMASVRPGMSAELPSISHGLKSTIYSSSAKPSPMVKSTSSQQCNAVAAGTTAECAPKQGLMAAKEIKGADSVLGSSASEEQVRQNGKCTSTTELCKSVEGHKAENLAPVVENHKVIVEHPKESSLTDDKQVDVDVQRPGENLVPDMIKKQGGSSSVLEESISKVTAAS